MVDIVHLVWIDYESVLDFVIHPCVPGCFVRCLVDLVSVADHLESSHDQLVIGQIVIAFEQEQLQVVVVEFSCYFRDQVVRLGVSIEAP